MANQPIGCNIRKASDGSAFTTPVNVWITGDTNPAFQGSVGGGVVVPDARGYAQYVPAAFETQYGHIAFTFDAAGAIGDTVQVATYALTDISSQQTANGLTSVVVNELLLEALIEIRQGRAGDALEPELLLWALGKLNRMLDKWNADPEAKASIGFASYVPTVNQGQRTLGPTGDFVTSSRPDRILGANLILNTITPAIRIPIDIRDKYWWLNNVVQGVSASIVTDLYYEPSWPNGMISLWPVPTIAYPIELMTDSLLGKYAMADTLWLPFGYREAITLTLAELCAPGCGQNISMDLKEMAADARVIVFGNNIESRNIRTRDAGMPGGGAGGRGRARGYLYRTGRIQ